MTDRRRALHAIADLIGVPRLAVRGVERRANGAYAILLRAAGDPMPSWALGRRVLRIPRRRVEGYRPSSPYVRPRDQRARRKQNAHRMAIWLLFRLDADAPVVERALWHGDLEPVEELRAAILAAAPPEPEPAVVIFVNFNGNGGEAAA